MKFNRMFEVWRCVRIRCS